MAHIARHQVGPDEVEEICHGEHVARQAYGGRLMLIGLTRAGRTLSVILDPEGDGVYRAMTARPSSRKERRVYRDEQEGGDE